MRGRTSFRPWQAIPKEKLDHYQTFEVIGKVEGLDLEARAKVSVEGIVSVEEVSVTTPIAEAPLLCLGWQVGARLYGSSPMGRFEAH